MKYCNCSKQIRKNIRRGEYYDRSIDHYLIHEDTAALLELLLNMLALKGEKETFSFIKTEVLKGNIVVWKGYPVLNFF